MRNLLAVALLLAPAPIAYAAEDYEDLDSEGKTKKPRPTDEDEEDKPAREEVIREIERGVYFKSNVGATAYLLTYGATPYGSVLASGTSLSFAVGQDFVDNEKNSMAWEVAFDQGVHNGLNWQYTAQGINNNTINPNAAIQGDTRTFRLLGNVEYSVYPSRRLGVGGRLGGGVMYAPLLMGRVAFQDEVAPDFGSTLPVHSTPHPLGFGGATFEYYTKLSHFSVGADVDVSYALGFDLGLSTTGYFKYTL